MLNYQQKLDLFNTDPLLGASLMNGLPTPEDEFLYYGRGSNYKTYEQMRRDAEISRSLKKRVQLILGRQLMYKPKTGRRKDAIAAQGLEKIAELMQYESFTREMVESGMLIGFAVAGLFYDERDGYIVPRWEFVPQDRITFKYPNSTGTETIYTTTDEDLAPDEILTVRGYELRLLTKRSPFYGERCPKGRFVCLSFGGHTPWGLGLGYSLYPWWELKRHAMAAWLCQSDRLGSPPVTGETPNTLDERSLEVQSTLRAFDSFLKSISPNGWARFPAGFKATLLEQVNSASPDVHERLVKVSDFQMQKVILQDVQFSDLDHGSYAANESQVEDREMSLTDGDCNLIDEQMSDQLWGPLSTLNFPTADRPWVYRETHADRQRAIAERQRQEALKTRAERDKILLVDMGLRATNEYIQQTYGEEWSLPGATVRTAPSDEDVIMGDFNFAEESYAPPKGVQDAAKRGLEVRESKPPSQRGGTEVGLARARDLANGRSVSPETIKRMLSYFQRHEVDKEGETWSEQGKGWQAWHLWGGDAGYAWVKRITSSNDFSEPIVLSGRGGELLSEDEWDDLAEISEGDIQDAMDAMV